MAIFNSPDGGTANGWTLSTTAPLISPGGINGAPIYGSPVYTVTAPVTAPLGVGYRVRSVQWQCPAGYAAFDVVGVGPPAPDVPQFSNVTQTTLTATLPAFTTGTLSFSLEYKVAGQTTSTYVTAAQNQGSGAVVAVTGLYGSTNYIFRCRAVGNQGSTPSADAPVTTDLAPPQAPSAPTFSDLSEEGVLVHAPALPNSATFLRLQMKLSSQSDLAYRTLANNIEGGAIIPSGALTSNAGHDFRFVAVGTGGQTAGSAASLYYPPLEISWQSGVAISCGGVRWPGTGNTIAQGGEGHLSSFLATDFDQRDVTFNGQLVSSRPHSDPCSYQWSATWANGTPAGSFKNGVNRGQGVVWIAPTTPGMVTLRLVVNDQASTNQGNGEGGARSDAPRGYNDDALTFSAAISVLP